MSGIPPLSDLLKQRAQLQSKIDILQQMLTKNPNSTKFVVRINEHQDQVDVLNQQIELLQTPVDTKPLSNRIINDDISDEEIIVPSRRRTIRITTSSELASPDKYSISSSSLNDCVLQPSVTDPIHDINMNALDDNDGVDEEIQSRHKEIIPLPLTNSNLSVANLLDTDLNSTQLQENLHVISTPFFNRRKSIMPRKSIAFVSPEPSTHRPDHCASTTTSIAATSKSTNRLLLDSDSSEDDTIIIKRPLQPSKHPEPTSKSSKISSKTNGNPEKVVQASKTNQRSIEKSPPQETKVPRLLQDSDDDIDHAHIITSTNDTKKPTTTSKPVQSTVLSTSFEDLLNEVDDVPDNPFKPMTKRDISSDEEDQTIFIQPVQKFSKKNSNHDGLKLTAKEAAEAIARASTLGKLTKGLNGVQFHVDSGSDDSSPINPSSSTNILPISRGKGDKSSTNTPMKTNVKSLNVKSAFDENSPSSHSSIAAFLNFDNLIKSMYTHTLFPSNQSGNGGYKTKTNQSIAPSVMYLKYLLYAMIDVPNLDQSYHVSSNPKLKGKAVVPLIVRDFDTDFYDHNLERSTLAQSHLFNHIFPPFLRLKPLPHQVYSFFWLIAHERDHDYFLYRYNYTVSAYFDEFLASRQKQVKFSNPYDSTSSSLSQSTQSNQSLSQMYNNDQSMTSSLLSPMGIIPSTLPLVPEIDYTPHLPLLAGGLLCDDCGLGKTYQLIALTASDIPRIGLMRGYEWIRLTLRHLQRKKLTQCKEQYHIMLAEYKVMLQNIKIVNESEKIDESDVDTDDNLIQYSPKQLSELLYNIDPYVVRLSIILHEMSLFLTNKPDMISQRRGVGMIPHTSTTTQLYMYVCSLFSYISRNYSIGRKNSTFLAQYDLLCDILAYIGIDSSLFPHYPEAMSASPLLPHTSTQQSTQLSQDVKSTTKTRIIIDSDSDDEIILKPSSKAHPPSAPTLLPSITTPSFQTKKIVNKDKLPHLRMLETCPLCHDNNEHKVGGLYGATLVVCVKSVMTQWEQEIKAICGTHPFPAHVLYSMLPSELRTPNHQKYINSFPKASNGSEDIPLCNVFLYHANNRLQLFNNAWDYEGQVDEMREKYADSTICSCTPRYSFVVTTYETLRSDYNRFLLREKAREEEKLRKKSEKQAKKEKARLKKGKSAHISSDDDTDNDEEDGEDQIELSEITLQDVTWARIIFDECHKVKNASTQNYKAAFELMTCNDIWYDECVNHEQALLSQYKKLSSKASGNTKSPGDIEGLLNPDLALTTRPGGRYCVSATPLHNSESDLFSLIKLLRFRPYNKKRNWDAVVEKDKLTHKACQASGVPTPPGLLWAIIQSCMIRRERTEKNDPKYTALIKFLQNGFETSNNNTDGAKSGNRSTNPFLLTELDDMNISSISPSTKKDGDLDENPNQDDMESLLAGMSGMSIVASSTNSSNAVHIDTIPTKSEWKAPYNPTLLLHIPTGPNTPDKPLFIKHFIKQTPVEELLYLAVTNFAKARLEEGESISLEGDDSASLDRTAQSVINNSKIKNGRRSYNNDEDLIPIPTSKKGKKTTKPNYSYANALQVLQLLQQCSSSLFFLTPNFIPLTFNLLRLDLRKQMEESTGDQKAELECYFGLDMIAKRPKSLLEDPDVDADELNRLMLFIHDECDMKTGVTNGDKWDSSDDESYDFNVKLSSNMASSAKNEYLGTKPIQRSAFSDDDDDDGFSNLATALDNLSLTTTSTSSSNLFSNNATKYTLIEDTNEAFARLTTKTKHSSLAYKKQPNRPITFLQFVDMYRRLLLNSRLKPPTNTVSLNKMQKQLAYIKPKYTTHHRNASSLHESRIPTYGYSSKMAYLLYLLTYISFTQPGASIIIFSQFTRTLDILEHALANHSGYYNSYLHQYTNNTTSWCSRCDKQRPLFSSASSAPHRPTPPIYPKRSPGDAQGNSNMGVSPMEYPTPTEEELQLDLSYLDETSCRTVLHSLQMPSYVSYCDTDLYNQSLNTHCNCGTCQYGRTRIEERRDDLDFDEDKITTKVLTQLRPHEELYYEAQSYSTPSIIRCHCCLEENDDENKKKGGSNQSSTELTRLQLQSALSTFKGFGSITRIDGRQGKDEQEEQKKIFKKPVAKASLSHLGSSLNAFELSHSCQCKLSEDKKPTPDQLNNVSQSLQSTPNNLPLPLNLMLISLKAGGVGLNLVEASHVILFEANWNPMDRFQAMCRCIRNFQTKTVFVHELCALGTIEEKVFNVRQNKRLLSKQIVETGAIGTNVQALQMTLSDISSLLDNGHK